MDKDLMNPPQPKEIGLREAAEYLGLKPKTLYNLIGDGQGPRRVKEGRYWKFTLADLDRYRSQRRETKEAYTK